MASDPSKLPSTEPVVRTKPKRRFSQIFADFCRFSPFLENEAFGNRRFSQKTVDCRRKPQEPAENRRLAFVFLGLSPKGLAQPYVEGLPPSVVQRCSHHVEIPTVREASLNVACCGSILMYDRELKHRLQRLGLQKETWETSIRDSPGLFYDYNQGLKDVVQQKWFLELIRKIPLHLNSEIPPELLLSWKSKFLYRYRPEGIFRILEKKGGDWCRYTFLFSLLS